MIYIILCNIYIISNIYTYIHNIYIYIYIYIYINKMQLQGFSNDFLKIKLKETDKQMLWTEIILNFYQSFTRLSAKAINWSYMSRITLSLTMMNEWISLNLLSKAQNTKSNVKSQFFLPLSYLSSDFSSCVIWLVI